MTTYHGKNGVARIGANAIAEVQEFSVTEQTSTADDTSMGDQAETHLIGIDSWNGSVKCSLDVTDATGQQAMTKGASVSLNLFPAGVGVGKMQLSGTATITEVTRTTNRSNVVEVSFNFKGNGALANTVL